MVYGHPPFMNRDRIMAVLENRPFNMKDARRSERPGEGPLAPRMIVRIPDGWVATVTKPGNCLSPA